ncbi:MAG: glycosyltransferase [Ignavibacteriaceae bacterium]|nr:glycosyltransferase [Ignavibacteriaceae bacterium]
MKYSIIIPTLNEEKLLPNLLNQLKQVKESGEFEIEIVISDGGSIDGTLLLAVNRADKIIGREINTKNSISSGRNNGARVSSGEILVFVNADILFEDIFRFFRFLDESFRDSENIAMTTKVKIFPEEEILTDKIFHGFYNYYFFLLNKLSYGMGRGECQVVKREFFEMVNGYNPELIAGEDFDLFKRLKRKGKILFELSLTVYESPRRFRKYGYSAITLEWLKNALAIIVRNRSISKVWEQVR